MFLHPPLHEEQKRNRDAGLASLVRFEILRQSLPKFLMLSSVVKQPREIMLLHQRFFGSKVNQRILDQPVQDRI